MRLLALTLFAGLGAIASTSRAAADTPDQDFVAAMIALDQSAIDRARLELQFGIDPALRAHAQSVIAARTADLAAMIRWQETHPAPPAP